MDMIYLLDFYPCSTERRKMEETFPKIFVIANDFYISQKNKNNAFGEIYIENSPKAIKINIGHKRFILSEILHHQRCEETIQFSNGRKRSNSTFGSRFFLFSFLRLTHGMDY